MVGVMQSTANFPPFAPSETGGCPAFNVVIAYEDFETGKHAKKTYDFLQAHLGEDCQFSSQMWKFDVLAVPKLRELAAKDAVAADIIIVSAHGRDELPPEVKSWIEMWMREQSRAIALVGLFSPEAYLENPVRTHLASVARRCRIEFFSQPGIWPNSACKEAPGGETRAGMDGKAMSVLAGMEQEVESDVSHWGINE